MKAYLFAALLTSAPLAVLPSPLASAGCTSHQVATFVQGQIHIELVRQCGGAGDASSEQAIVATIPIVGTLTCAGAALVAHLPLATFCQPESPDEAAVLTAGTVARALQDLPLPASRLHVQPPGGQTLVNFETNFFTQREAFTRHVNLLGQHVTLRIRPSAFTWHFDDDATATTSTPGAPYPDLDVTHSYATTDPVNPRVDTTYSAEWRVAGGAWQPVPGTVTITGATVALEVREARPTLVAQR